MADLDDLYGRALGEFVLGERLDRGGFGTVYRAAQQGLRRGAVVKVLHRRAIRSQGSAQRVAREALLSSQLDHPYAAHVYAFGIEEDGLVWIAMELIQGVTLKDWLAKHHRMSLEQFVPFFERLAEVVHVAHERGIVHRDLKPSNVMLIERAAQLLPKLLDFGVAALLDGVTLPYLADAEALVLTDDTPQELAVAGDAVATVRLRVSSTPRARGGHRRTRASAAVGSPPYMAPEQWDGSEVAPAMDLYALGVLAYEALTGHTPFVAKNPPEYADLHRRAPVPPLGTELAALDGLFQRALAKRPADRFHSALEFSAALRFELETRMAARIHSAARQWHKRGRPSALLWRDEVLAELQRWIERSTKADTLGIIDFDFLQACQDLANAQLEAQERKVARRRRLSIAAAVIAVAALVGVFQFRAADETRNARRIAAASAVQSEVEQGRAALLHDDLVEAQQHLTEAVRIGDHSPATLFMLARASQPLRAELARFAARSGRMWSAAWSPDGRRVVTSDDSAAQIWDVDARRLVATLPHDDIVPHAIFSPDGTVVVTAGNDGTVRIWRASDGAPIRVLRAHGSLHYFVAAMSPDQRFVAAVDGSGAIVHVWDVATGAVLAEFLGSGMDLASLAFSSDGRWLATGGGDNIRVYKTGAWTLATTIGASIRSIAWDPKRPRLATGTSSGDASIWTMPGGTRVQHLREVGEAVDAVAWSPDGQLVATAGRDGSEQVWGANTGRLVSQSNQLHDKIFAIEFDPASRLLAAAGANGATAISDVTTGMPVSLLEGPAKLVRTSHFAPSSQHVLGASWDGTARIWDASSQYRRWNTATVAEDCGFVTSLEPDRRMIAIPCRDRVTRIWDTAPDRLLVELPPTAVLPAVSGDGQRAAIAHDDIVDIYQVPGGKLLRSLRHSAPVSALAFSTDGHDVICGATDGSVLVIRDGHPPLALPPALRALDAVALLADGRALAADAGGHLRVIAGGVVVADLESRARISLLRPSPEGDRLVGVPAATTSTAPMLWDLVNYRVVGQLDGHLGRVFSARWVTSSRLLTAGGDGSAHMWDSNGAQLMIYRGSTRFLADAVLSPSGDFVAGGGADGRLRFWDAVTGRPLWTTPAHTGAVVGVHYEGEDVITRGVGGDIARWQVSTK